MTSLKSYKDRTNAKLLYARVHLDELQKYEGKVSNDNFERAHQESFLFHLYGVRDAFLQELNLKYVFGLEPDKVNMTKLLKKAGKMKIKCFELERIKFLEEDPESWLSYVQELRHYQMHRNTIIRHFNIGGENHKKVFYIHPKTGEKVTKDIFECFEDWYLKMGKLITELRKFYNLKKETA